VTRPKIILNDKPPGGLHPYVVWLPFALALIGLPLVFGGAQPGTIASLLNPLLVKFWGGFFLFGGPMTVIGLFWRNRATGMIIEQVGSVAVAAGALLYAGALVTVIPIQSSVVVVGVFGSLGGACVVRWFQLRKLLNDAMREAMWLQETRAETETQTLATAVEAADLRMDNMESRETERQVAREKRAEIMEDKAEVLSDAVDVADAKVTGVADHLHKHRRVEQHPDTD